MLFVGCPPPLQADGTRIDALRVETVLTAAASHRLLAEESVDCIVTEYALPERSGIEFLTAVREDYPKLPVIVYTAAGSEAVASAAIDAGVTDYLPARAMDTAELGDAIQDAVTTAKNGVTAARRNAATRPFSRIQTYSWAFSIL